MVVTRLKKGDMVKVISGSLKGKTGKIVSVLPKQRAVKVEGLNTRKRHVKPNMLSATGGVKDIHIAIDISKVAYVSDTKGTTSRISYTLNKSNKKVRTLTQFKNKEIDS